MDPQYHKNCCCTTFVHVTAQQVQASAQELTCRLSFGVAVACIGLLPLLTAAVKALFALLLQVSVAHHLECRSDMCVENYIEVVHDHQ